MWLIPIIWMYVWSRKRQEKKKDNADDELDVQSNGEAYFNGKSKGYWGFELQQGRDGETP